MRLTFFLSAGLLAAWSLSSGEVAAGPMEEALPPAWPAGPGIEVTAVEADTILWEKPPGFLEMPSLTEPARDSVPRTVALGLGRVPAPFDVEFDPPPGLESVWFRSPGETMAGLWIQELERTIRASRPSVRTIRMAGTEGSEVVSDTAAFLPEERQPRDRRRPAARPGAAGQQPPPGEPEDTATQLMGEEELPDFFTDHADLGMRLRGRGELGGDWVRFTPCDVLAQFNCNPSAIPQLDPEIQFGVQLQGTVSDRVHLNVDFDQTREFSAANNINVWYEGLEDEILQRLEVGDVTFNLPDSRLLTQGIPAGNFGFRATGQLGPIDFQTVWAQQKGDLSEREFTLSGAGDSQGFVQEDTLVVDDADYVQGQFFFLFDPRTILDYPHIDIQSLDPSAAPPAQVPASQPIQLYRFESDPVTRQQVEGYVQADAVATLDGDTITESGWFRFLQPGVDYFVHPSSMWVALRSPLRDDEMLAVTYITASGDTVGDYNPERIHNQGGRPELRLLRASQGLHQPGRPTWEREMHNIYRVSGSSDVQTNSVELTISLGELSAGQTFKRGIGGEDITFLRLLGLDEESPRDELDRAAVYKPADDSFEDQPPVSGTFIVFPTLRPFQEPPPVPSLGLSADQTAEILGGDANPTIYEADDPFERDNGGLYRLTIPFRVQSEGVVSSFSLGALGIRDGSERITMGNRVLQPREDYIIDYDLGQVTLLDAQNLFAQNPDAEIRATFEQKSIFQVAPTSVFGMNATYDLGDRGELNFMTLLQNEDELVRRPQLGVEAASIFLGGVNGDLSFGASWLDRALDHVPGLHYSGESSLDVQGELALSMPNPNTQGDVFLDDFDATNELPLSVGSQAWRLSSAPEFREGAVDALPPALNASDVASLTWQHTWITGGAGGDSTGIFEGFIPQEDIDRQIRRVGTNRTQREQALLITLGMDESLEERRFDRRRWRSMVTNLSTTGQDLTKTEFLEMYVARGDSATLIIDLGQVSEDAFFVNEDGRTTGTREADGREWGLGTLDQEADPRQGQIWNNDLDQLGVWDESCLAARTAAAYPVASPRANCTRNNGRPDSEDLDGDGNLDTAERYLRYVVKLDGSSPYLERDVSETGSPVGFELYRIPIQGPNSINVGGLFTEADLRAVKQLRITVTSNESEDLLIARPRLIGSRWIKRARTGVVRGLAGDTTGTGGEVEVTPVSTLSEGGAYTSPPGVLEQLDDPTEAFGGQAVEFNEKSLGIRYSDVAPGERVEVWTRFPQRPRNFLTYRQARIWAVARRGDWGPEEPRNFFLKVGSDAENFYLFRTRLDPAPDPEAVAGGDWLPEIVVDFEKWLDLRRAAEEELIRNPRSPGDPPLVIWADDSTHAVVLKDRGRAPNLAAVRELAMGIQNEGDAPTSGEVWVDEFRLSGAVRDPGGAGYVDMNLRAADVMSARVSYQNRGPLFRQLEGDPSYQEDRSLSVNSTLRLDRFLPAGWGIDLPVTVTHSRSDREPTFLNQSDVRADRLEGLREVGSRRTRLGVTFRKRTPAANPLVNVLLNGLDARVGYTTSTSSTVTSESESSVFDARLGYDRQLEPRSVEIVPGFMEPLLRFVLPGFLEERVVESSLRWSPERISFGSSYFRQENESRRYEQILELPGDTAVVPSLSPREGLDSDAQVSVRPFESLTGNVSLRATRDLLEPEQAVNDPEVQALLEQERRALAGADLGWETNRSVQTRLDWRPRFTSWLQTTYGWSTVYNSNRNANFVDRRILESGDTVQNLERNVNGQRSQNASVSLETGGLVASIFGEVPEDGDPEASFLLDGLRAVTEALAPLNVQWTSALTSRFNRGVVDPAAGYQFGFGSPDRFRFIDGDTAASLADRTTLQASSGLRLPLGLDLSVAYSQSDARTLDTRSERSVDSETWPDVQARFTSVPLPGFMDDVLDRVSLSTGYRRRIQMQRFDVEGQNRRFQDDRSVPMEFSLRFAGNTSFTYRGSFQEGLGRDATGNTETLRTSHSVNLTSSFTPPGELGRRIDKPMRLTVQYRYSAQSDCRITSGQEECVPYVDQLNRSMNLTMDSDVGGVNLGLQGSYSSRKSFVGQQQGSTQFQIGFFGEFLFSAGTLGVR